MRTRRRTRRSTPARHHLAMTVATVLLRRRTSPPGRAARYTRYEFVSTKQRYNERLEEFLHAVHRLSQQCDFKSKIFIKCLTQHFYLFGMAEYVHTNCGATFMSND
ncbi:hypothetical protein T10_4535 [Trichinella papuae]|uniref:Uncharacterized protein n=1 Tax=Trichinella papuae TaxID=268474 RepID=A0A0V1M2R9_9BILA|nr:hypothetical protein T10_6178 [Trichinella papuae]KRZ67314.1 hypothetical protein T10_4535 [Trichinella papuae]